MQAHLSTANYDDAMNGLKNVRRFRLVTLWIKYPLDMFLSLITDILNTFQFRGIKDRQVMSWTKATTYRPSVGQTMVRLATDAQHVPFQEFKEYP